MVLRKICEGWPARDSSKEIWHWRFHVASFWKWWRQIKNIKKQLQHDEAGYVSNHQYTTTDHKPRPQCLGELHRQCPCDDDGGVREDHCSPDVVFTSDQFSRKQLRNAAILALKTQKPSTNALNGLHLPCVDRMLEALGWRLCWVVIAEAYTCVWRKSRRELPFTYNGVDFQPMGRCRYIRCF